MYETIQGEKIDGEIIIRKQKTMVVQNDSGRHLCWLVGAPAPRHTGIKLPNTPPRKKIEKPERPMFPVRVIFPTGATKDFPSINQAAKSLGVANSVVLRNYNESTRVRRGIAKGCRFVPIMEG